MALAAGLVPAAFVQQSVVPAQVTGQARTPDVELRRQFDQDKNGWLNLAERTAARTRLAEIRAGRGRGGRGGAVPPAEPGRRVAPADVERLAGVPLYDSSRLRTVFLEFEDTNWEEELEAFYRTDIELPATLRADGRTYQNVGVQFRGNSSFSSVPRGRKRSLSISLDHVTANQRLEGYTTLTMLNAHSDPTFLRSMLYLDIARQYMPALKASYVRVVINGESWGIYVNQQRFNKDFLREAFGADSGIRYKSSNRSRGGSFAYLGDTADEYRKWYEIQGTDSDEAWKPLMNVTKVLAVTPPGQLKPAIEPILNVDGALRYLALDIVMMSGDGYWLYGSDFNLYADPKGVLHILHHDTNEAFTAQGPGGRGGGPLDAKADPLGYTDDPLKALRNKLLAVPEYRAKYMEYVRHIAQNALDWSKVEPRINAWRSLIRADVDADTRKLYSTDEFATAVFGSGEAVPPPTTLKGFILQRREYLLAYR
jgi:hypothetical protein